MAGGPILTATYAKSLYPGVSNWYGAEYDRFPKQWLEIFDIHQSERNFEEDVLHHGLSLAPRKPESSNLKYQTMGQVRTVRYEHKVYGTGFKISREAVEDNLYRELAEQRSGSLATAMKETKEHVTIDVLNSGFVTTLEDGVPLFSESHPLARGGTQSNLLDTDADLSESSLEQAIIDLMNMLDDDGLHITVIAQKLVIPVSLCFEATRILKSILQNDTANNAINALKSKGVLPEGMVINNYLEDQSNWFLKTNVRQGMKLLERRDASIEIDTDYDSENVKYKSTMRFIAGVTNFRNVFGAAG